MFFNQKKHLKKKKFPTNFTQLNNEKIKLKSEKNQGKKINHLMMMMKENVRKIKFSSKIFQELNNNNEKSN